MAKKQCAEGPYGYTSRAHLEERQLAGLRHLDGRLKRRRRFLHPAEFGVAAPEVLITWLFFRT